MAQTDSGHIPGGQKNQVRAHSGQAKEDLEQRSVLNHKEMHTNSMQDPVTRH
jgi:hypothetical protein